jgi:hypothetical protein
MKESFDDSSGSANTQFCEDDYAEHYHHEIDEIAHKWVLQEGTYLQPPGLDK